MRRSMLALAPAAVVIAIAGCGGGGTSNAGKTSHPAAGTAQTAARSGPTMVGVGTTKPGQILVDSQSRSLYLFEKDTGTASTCYGACASSWPPLTASGIPKAGGAIVAAKLGTTKRTDGQTQVTYNRHPLYYYAGDTAPGQTTGQGLKQFGAGWDVVAPSGNKIEGGK
jgi:predicted lipoprotein with Yx(FWY)xxD motif